MPADAGIYFTEELERRLNALLLQIQPDAQTDLDGYVDTELEQWVNELDRLSLVARAEAGRAGRRGLTGKQRARWRLVRRLQNLETQTKSLRKTLRPKGRRKISLEPPRRGRLRDLEAYRARTKIEEALRDLVPKRKSSVKKLRTAIDRLVEQNVPRIHVRAKGD